MEKKLTPYLLLLLVVVVTLETVEGCSNGFIDSPSNTMNFLKNGSGSLLTGIQIIIPDMEFTCSGHITEWRGWFTLDRPNAFNAYLSIQLWEPTGPQSYRLISEEFITTFPSGSSYISVKETLDASVQMYYQPGDVVGMYIGSTNAATLTPLISNNTNGNTLYYATLESSPCNFRLCDTRLVRLEGIDFQITPLTSNNSDNAPARSLVKGCDSLYRPDCPIPTTQPTQAISTTQSSTQLLQPTTTMSITVAVLTGVSSFVLFAAAIIVTVLVIIVCVVHFKHTLRKKTHTIHAQDPDTIQHYAAKTGELYTSIGGKGNQNIGNEDCNAGNESLEMNTHLHSHHMFASNQNLPETPPPLPPFIPSSLPRLNSVSSQILSPRIRAMSDSQNGINFRCSTLPLSCSKKSIVRPSSARSVLQIGLSSVPAPYEMSMTTLNEQEHTRQDPTTFNQTDFDTPNPYTNPTSFKDSFQSITESFPYSVPVSVSPTKELFKPPLPESQLVSTAYFPSSPNPYSTPVDTSPTKFDPLPPLDEVERPSDIIFGGMDNVDEASPYMQPSPVGRKKPFLEDHFRERIGTGSSIATSFVYIPPEILSQAYSQSTLRGQEQMTLPGDSACFHVPSHALRTQYKMLDNDAIYSKLERNVGAQGSTCCETGDSYWEPSTSADELYDQLADRKYTEIPRHSIELSYKIGAGNFGTVHKGVWYYNEGKKSVAVKQLKLNAPDNEQLKFLQEAAIMGQFCHPNIVQLYGVVTIGKPLMIVIELMPRKDLKRFLRGIAKGNKLPDIGQQELSKHLLTFSHEIANGMEYLASKGFVHRDLATRNILLTEDLTCKVGDFGMARDLSGGEYDSQGGVIPLKWTAPEAVQYKRYTTASDVWSYGMVLFEIWSLGKKPYNDMSTEKLLSVLNTGYCQAPPPGCPRALYHLMVKCWNPYEQSRPKFVQIMADLKASEDYLLHWSQFDEVLKFKLGDPLEKGAPLYRDLQFAYKSNEDKDNA